MQPSCKISQLPNPPCRKEDFEPYPKPFSNRWKGLKQIIAARRRLFLCFGIAGRRDDFIIGWRTENNLKIYTIVKTPRGEGGEEPTIFI